MVSKFSLGGRVVESESSIFTGGLKNDIELGKKSKKFSKSLPSVVASTDSGVVCSVVVVVVVVVVVGLLVVVVALVVTGCLINSNGTTSKSNSSLVY